jgi:streptomycin 6-kinase
MVAPLSEQLLDRIHQHAQQWRLEIEESFQTETSVISFVSRQGQGLVLKIIKRPGDDEWNAGQVLSIFGGRGMVQVYEYTGGAMLLEHLQPGTLLSRIDDDEAATQILATVIEQMSPSDAPEHCPRVADWGLGFARYLAGTDTQIPRPLVESAQSVFGLLSASQTSVRLLHGDLHHYNVLWDANRGWVAIDPKGVIGELEYEAGALLRNPVERPEVFLAPQSIERRVKQFATQLNLQVDRMVGWGFAQAVLSAIWQVEDEGRVASNGLQLAQIMQRML